MPILTSAQLWVEITYKGANAPWIILSNSVLTTISIWDAQVAGLAQAWNIVRYDQRGHGRSAVSEAPLSFDDFGGDVVAIMDDVGIPETYYVGLSMGVPTGLAAYRLAPHRFKRLVFVDGQAASAASGAAFWDERIALARNEGMNALAGQTTARWLKSMPQDDVRADALRQMIAATPVEGFVSAASALRRYDYSATLDALSIPLRMIAGAEDGAIPEAMARMSARVPGSQLTILPGCGHIPNFEAPDAFNAALQAALS